MQFISLFIVVLCATHAFGGDKGNAGYRGYNIKGQKGKKGDPGENMDCYESFKGIKGNKGFKGYPGYTGEPGMQGPTGLMGPKGFKGDRGMVGLEGRKGRKGISGSYDCTEKLSSLLISMPEMRGPPGDKGTPGAKGTPGDKGTPGLDGMPGFNGANVPSDCTAEQNVMKLIASELKQLSVYNIEKTEQIKQLTENITKYNTRLVAAEKNMVNLNNDIEFLGNSMLANS